MQQSITLFNMSILKVQVKPPTLISVWYRGERGGKQMTYELNTMMLLTTVMYTTIVLSFFCIV